MSLPAAGFRNRFRSPVQRLGGAFRPRPESPGIVYNAARRPGLAPASQDPFRRGPRVRPGHKKDFLVAQRKLLATPSHLLDSLYRGRAGQRMNYISKHFRLPETGSVEAHPELHRAGKEGGIHSDGWMNDRLTHPSVILCIHGMTALWFGQDWAWVFHPWIRISEHSRQISLSCFSGLPQGSILLLLSFLDPSDVPDTFGG